MMSSNLAVIRHARSLMRRIKDVLRPFLGTQDPFRDSLRVGASPQSPYHSQYGQDRVCHEELFGDRNGGIFVDVGAHDGVSFSNTIFFEHTLGWRGLCIEPIPEIFGKLIGNRSAICVQACVARETGTKKFLRVRGYAEMLSGLVDEYDARHIQRVHDEVNEYGGSIDTINVRTARLDTLFREHGIEKIDLLCIDVEGAEIQVLESFELSSVRPAVVCVENNYLDKRIWRLLRKARYRPYVRIRQDEIWLAFGFVPTGSTGIQGVV